MLRMFCRRLFPAARQHARMHAVQHLLRISVGMNSDVSADRKIMRCDLAYQTVRTVSDRHTGQMRLRVECMSMHRLYCALDLTVCQIVTA